MHFIFTKKKQIHFWKTGVVLEDNLQNIALVQLHQTRKTIAASVRGPSPGLDCIPFITDTFSENLLRAITATFDLLVESQFSSVKARKYVVCTHCLAKQETLDEETPQADETHANYSQFTQTPYLFNLEVSC